MVAWCHAWCMADLHLGLIIGAAKVQLLSAPALVKLVSSRDMSNDGSQSVADMSVLQKMEGVLQPEELARWDAVSLDQVQLLAELHQHLFQLLVWGHSLLGGCDFDDNDPRMIRPVVTGSLHKLPGLHGSPVEIVLYSFTPQCAVHD